MLNALIRLHRVMISLILTRQPRYIAFVVLMGRVCQLVLDAIPCLKSISLSPAQIDAKNGMGLRASCDIRLQDFPHDDIRIDPYVMALLIYPSIKAHTSAN